MDCVVIYKVDRLSRSLLDFSRILELFEMHHVSFVSVTQLFNTANSMGRLMLNVLLSFAQFEREIISERTWDKIAAARRKGTWVGGMPLLGYDVDPKGSKLVVNKLEAKRICSIFDLYLNHRSLIRVIAELDQRPVESQCLDDTLRDRTQRKAVHESQPSQVADERHVHWKGSIQERSSGRHMRPSSTPKCGSGCRVRSREMAAPAVSRSVINLELC